MGDVFNMEDRKCSTCISYEDGTCHKNAPTAFTEDGFGVFPRVRPDKDWCMEYNPSFKNMFHTF